MADLVPGTERTRLAVAGARAATKDGMLGRQPRADVVRSRAFLIVLLVLVGLALAGLAALIIDALSEGASRFDISLLTEPASRIAPETAGYGNAILGTIYLVICVLALAVPLGVGAALYLEEYADTNRWWNRVIEVNIQNLAAVPSIVYGILGLAFIVRGPLDLGFIVVAGGMTLALLVLPTVIIAAREALRSVPPSIREGSLALGATRWQTVRRQVLPAAIPGIATGVILAVSRAAGETAPLLLVGAATFVTFNPTFFSDNGYTALPVMIFNNAKQAQPEFLVLAAAGIIVMLVVLLLMNSFAIWLRNHYEQRW
jgi:phosphate transport system permease protein